MGTVFYVVVVVVVGEGGGGGVVKPMYTLSFVNKLTLTSLYLFKCECLRISVYLTLFESLFLSFSLNHQIL